MICIQCAIGREEGGECRRQDIFSSNTDTTRRVVNDREVSFERVARERSEGTRQRDTASTINGALERSPCSNGLSCVEDTCSHRTTPESKGSK